MKQTFGLTIFIAVLILLGTSSNTPLALPTLKDAYKNYFPIGVAVGLRNLTGPEADLIIQQFNSVTPENAMKIGPIHPEENRYFWRDADTIVDFAQKNGLKVRGHTLCWHNQSYITMTTTPKTQPNARKSFRPKEHERRPKKPTDDGVLTPDMVKAQATHYKMLFNTFRKYKGWNCNLTVRV